MTMRSNKTKSCGPAVALAIIGLAVRAIGSMEKLTRDVQVPQGNSRNRVQALGDSGGHELRALEQRMNRNNEVLRSEIQRRFEAMLSHTLDGDGNVAFRVPPAGALEEAEESPADQG